MWTPLQLQVLLHSYGCRQPFPQKDSEVVVDAHNALEQADLIQESENDRMEQIFITTKRGDAMVNFMRRMPPPVTVFLDPRSGDTYNPED